VDEVAGVRGGEGGGDLGADPQRHAGRHGAGLEPLRQRPARQQLHHHVRDALAVLVERLTVVVDVRDVRVPDPGGGPGLRTDPRPRGRVRGVRAVEHLDRDRPVEHLVAGPPDNGHAARTETFLQPVAPIEHLQSLHRPSLPKLTVTDTGAVVTVGSRVLSGGGSIGPAALSGWRRDRACPHLGLAAIGPG
jgi:hypothetical protein